jgi:hypothetical protein
MPEELDSVNEWADLVQVVGFPLAILALLLAWYQLRRAARTARVQTALALDERLSQFEDVRAQLNREPLHVTDTVQLRRYIAVFERIGHALRLREIPLETVDQFYGHRFVKLLKCQDTFAIVERREGWEDFYYLWEGLRGYQNNKRQLAEPQPG